MTNPIQTPAISALLASLGGHVSDRYYKSTIVYLDGYTFNNCCFHNCTLVSQTGAFALKSCTIMNCATFFGPNAVRLIKLWNVFNTNPLYPQFNPTWGADGAVTVE